MPMKDAADIQSAPVAMPLKMGRHAASGYVVLRYVGGLRHDADARIQRDGGAEEDVADPLGGQAHLLEDRQSDDEQAMKPPV
jgi:hypothetical protein